MNSRDKMSITSVGLGTAEDMVEESQCSSCAILCKLA